MRRLVLIRAEVQLAHYTIGMEGISNDSFCPKSLRKGTRRTSSEIIGGGKDGGMNGFRKNPLIFLSGRGETLIILRLCTQFM